MLKQSRKQPTDKTLSFSWALLVGLLAIIAQVVAFYIRFGFFNTQASFANYAFFFLAGIIGGSILIYALNRQDSLQTRRIVFIAFLLASPLALLMMLAGGLVGPLGVLIAPQIPWAVFTWLGSLLGKRSSQV